MQASNNKRFKKYIDLICSRGGRIRMSDALRLGINRYTLYAMRKDVSASTRIKLLTYIKNT